MFRGVDEVFLAHANPPSLCVVNILLLINCLCVKFEYNCPVGKVNPNNLSENRRARFDYNILETFEAGIELSGQEVKSAREGRFVIAGSYAIIRGGEAWLLGSQIPPYQPKNAPVDYEPNKTRRLLLKKIELKNLSGRLEEKGLSLLPLKVYNKKNFIKIELGLGRSRKAEDKREYIKKRGAEREMRAAKR